MMFRISSSLRFWALILTIVFFAGSLSLSQAKAQEGLPKLPKPIQNLADEGAQIRYLGKDHGFDAWITIKNGQEQYFYVQPNGKAFVMGILFDETGRAITVDQVKRLREDGDSLLDTLATSDLSSQNRMENNKSFVFSSPAEEMFHDIENSNWVALGSPNAPVVYSFIDPQCPHCHSFVQDLRADLLDSQKIQLRMIPVGFKEETQSQAAFLLASPNPQERWMAHMDGDPSALPAKSEINIQGIVRNLALMQSWDFSVTPMLVYRSKSGAVKLVRGKPKSLDGLLADIGS